MPKIAAYLNLLGVHIERTSILLEAAILEPTNNRLCFDICSKPDFPLMQTVQDGSEKNCPQTIITATAGGSGCDVALRGPGRCGQKTGSLKPITIPPHSGGASYLILV